MHERSASHGFTLIELAVVLVIIGLLIGGVLAGRSLLQSSQTQSVITQTQSYIAAAGAFEQKYNGLPGDIADPDATKYGFAPRGQYRGGGDGNGIIEGNWWNAPGTSGPAYQWQGETCMFWRDLATASLISGNFTCNETYDWVGYSIPHLDQFLPPAKIGRGNHIYAWGNIYGNWISIAAGLPGANGTAVPGLTVKEAYDIDKKIDDGFPQTGNVNTRYLQGYQDWWAGTTYSNIQNPALPASPTSCMDNGNVNGALAQYSVGFNNGKGLNCALSFHL